MGKFNVAVDGCDGVGTCTYVHSLSDGDLSVSGDIAVTGTAGFTGDVTIASVSPTIILNESDSTDADDSYLIRANADDLVIREYDHGTTTYTTNE